MGTIRLKHRSIAWALAAWFLAGGGGAAFAMQQNQPKAPLSCDQAVTACLSFVLIEKSGADGDTHTNFCGMAQQECTGDVSAKLQSDLSRVSAMSATQARSALSSGGISCDGVLCTGQDNVGIGWHGILDKVLGSGGNNPPPSQQGDPPPRENPPSGVSSISEPKTIRVAATMLLKNYDDCVDRLTEKLKPSEARVILPDGYVVETYCRRQFPQVDAL